MYQALSVEAVKGRALCQTPWWIGELLLLTSYDRAREVWERPRVIDPSCGTGHLLVEAFRRTRGNHSTIPYTCKYPSTADALSRVHGVDLDPYAVLIARWRLLVFAAAPAWQGPGGMSDLRDLPLNVAHADALLSEDEPLLKPASYEVVVANPPYITVKDSATTAAIRARYREVCNGQYSLALPFHALMMRLLVDGGWCAQLTANSFMKRQFGKPYVEQWLPRYDAQWVIDTSGAYIPGHGTPTVILVHRNQKPSSPTVRAILGKRGEPQVPAVPAEGLVWSAIRRAVEERESLERLGRGAEAAWRADHHEAAATQPPRPLKPSGPAGVQETLFEILGDATDSGEKGRL